MGKFNMAQMEAEGEQIKVEMTRLGINKSDNINNCERCRYSVSPEQAGSKYYRGCRHHGIKIFSNYVCKNFQR